MHLHRTPEDDLPNRNKPQPKTENETIRQKTKLAKGLANKGKRPTRSAKGQQLLKANDLPTDKKRKLQKTSKTHHASVKQNIRCESTQQASVSQKNNIYHASMRLCCKTHNMTTPNMHVCGKTHEITKLNPLLHLRVYRIAFIFGGTLCCSVLIPTHCPYRSRGLALGGNLKDMVCETSKWTIPCVLFRFDVSGGVRHLSAQLRARRLLYRPYRMRGLAL